MTTCNAALRRARAPSTPLGATPSPDGGYYVRRPAHRIFRTRSSAARTLFVRRALGAHLGHRGHGHFAGYQQRRGSQGACNGGTAGQRSLSAAQDSAFTASLLGFLRAVGIAPLT